MDDAVFGAVRGAVSGAVHGAVWHGWIGGRLWLSWQAYTSFFRRIGLDLPGDTWDRDAAYAQAQSAGYWWPNRRFVMVCEPASHISTERVRPDGWGSHRLHREDGPAVAWDGWGLYAIHGVVVPERVVMAPETLTVAEIDAETNAETNAEVRRVMRERFGEGRYLRESGADLVAADVEAARKGAAPRALLRDKHGALTLVGTDGSTGRVYYMRARAGAKSCREAHEGLCGFDESLILNKS